jgi:hypothetical protein
MKLPLRVRGRVVKQVIDDNHHYGYGYEQRGPMNGEADIHPFS